MAFCTSPKGGTTVQTKVSHEIDKEIRESRRRLKQDVQILLLGAGESGKSTIFKQLKILQDNGKWTEQELLEYRNTIYVNITSQLHVLVLATESLNQPLSPQNIERGERIKNRQHGIEEFTQQVGEDCLQLWGDPSIKSVFQKRDKEFQLNDSAEYFFENLTRIIDSKYIPLPADALRTRIMTRGIIEAQVVFDEINMKIIDVGGQRSQRRKWIHCFDGVSAVIFVAALSEYDQFLREDDTVNRMDESLNLFNEIVNSRWFTNTSMILFLNKRDIFTEKLNTTPFSAYDPKYKGNNTYEETSQYIKSKFLSVREKSNQVYTHFTVAIDTQNINFVFKAVKEIILRSIFDDL
ncbi:G-protein subunit alpha 6 [Tieghemostelium lacteum]|uniref:G-protein subunit alpha 6 n=1 Tax=Tieghemostelium lacteum TaxID=361077 RepID=A0A151ZSD9_TIELA|nr:G-protein subunit alpha 6 [Tieghemostelium lacteum]|eukprot:KYQ96951.1 G-protein subunit alpha 6 [Tieghemostelium lacteum]